MKRQRHWINTETAIATLKQRDRPLKSKYLKDAFELLTAGDAARRSGRVQGNDGLLGQIGNSGTGDGDSRESVTVTNLDTEKKQSTQCHDGGCSKNSV